MQRFRQPGAQDSRGSDRSGQSETDLQVAEGFNDPSAEEAPPAPSALQHRIPTDRNNSQRLRASREGTNQPDHTALWDLEP